MNRPANKQPARVSQRGQAMVSAVLLAMVGVGAVIFTLVTPGTNTIAQQKNTAAALEQAVAALIGYAAGDNNRPGSLPCPDTNNDGTAELFAGTDCPGYVGGSNVYIGRLPWRTLGLPDPRDGNGERLWYAVSREFARNPSCAPGCPLNSDTAGQLTVTGPGAAANVIAVVFSPGAVTPGQVRDMANQNNAANYLEGDNANGDATFTTALPSQNFNDTALLVTRDNLFPTVEKRVAREIRQSLLTFFATNNYFPYAMPFDGSANFLGGLYRGRVPTQTCAPLIPTLSPVPLPTWVVPNNWHEVMVYAVAPSCTPLVNLSAPVLMGAPPAACNVTCTPFFIWWFCRTALSIGSLGCTNGPQLLTVTGVGNNLRSLILPAGYRLAGQLSPRNAATRLLENVQASTENHDNDGADNFVYDVPQRSATNNDQLLIVAP